MSFSWLTTSKAVLIIAAIGFIVFFNMLDGKFLLDDAVITSDNHQISLDSLFGTNPLYGTFLYRPIFIFYYKFLYLLFKEAAFFYHLTQLSIHIINTALLFILFKKFFTRGLALFLSLVFLVHPIQVESVSFITTASDPLFFLFGTMGLLISLDDSSSRKKIFASLALIFLSLLSKETGILFMLVLVIYKFIFKHKSWKVFAAYTFMIGLFYAYLRFGVANSYPNNKASSIALLTLQERITNIPAIVFHYLKTFFLPIRLATEQLWVVTRPNIQNFYFPLFADFLFFLTASLLGILIFLKDQKRFSVFLFFLLWFIGGIAIHLQIFPLDVTVADRFFYFPIAGLLGIIGISVNYINLKYEKRIGRLGLVLCVILISLLSIRTIVRNENWSDNKSIYIHDAKIENSWVLQKGLGNLQDSPGKSLVYFKKSVDSFAREDNLFSLGFTYEQLGKVDNAKRTYARIMEIPIRRRPDLKNHSHYLASYVRLARLLVLYYPPKEAKNEIQRALLDYPDSWQLWTFLALSNQKLQNQTGAIEAAKKTKSLYPSDYTKDLYEAILNNRPYPLPDSSIFDFTNLKAKK